MRSNFSHLPPLRQGPGHSSEASPAKFHRSLCDPTNVNQDSKFVLIQDYTIYNILSRTINSRTVIIIIIFSEKRKRKSRILRLFWPRWQLMWLVSIDSLLAPVPLSQVPAHVILLRWLCTLYGVWSTHLTIPKMNRKGTGSSSLLTYQSRSAGIFLLLLKLSS